MARHNALTILCITFMTPGLLHSWPQRPAHQQPVPVPATVPVPVPAIMEACNVTFTAEARSGRPTSPDPEPGDETKERANHEKIVFPGLWNSLPPMGMFPSDRTGIRQQFVPQVPSSERGPSCAEGSTFCVESDNYPSDYLSSLLKSDKIYREFSGQDVITEPNITQRIDASDEMPFCSSLEQVVYPKMAQNKEDKWLFIVNQDQFVQGVRVEKCIKEGPCTLTENLPIGYKTSCRQKYIYRKLLSLNEDGKAVSDAFRIPSCCACYFRTVTIINSRFGGGAMQATSPAPRGTRGGSSQIPASAAAPSRTESNQSHANVEHLRVTSSQAVVSTRSPAGAEPSRVTTSQSSSHVRHTPLRETKFRENNRKNI